MKGLIIVALLTASLAGCVSDSGNEGTASFYVKDAPTQDFDEIHVVFTAIEVHKTGSTGNETDDETGNETGNETESGWIMAYENATGQDVDLLNASGNKAVFLGEANLESGKYTQIRIHASSAYGILDGERVEIDLPNSVLKVVKSFTVGDGETRIVLDFDLDKSVKPSGDGWKMTPKIGKTYASQVESDKSGKDVHLEGETVELEELEEA